MDNTARILALNSTIPKCLRTFYLDKELMTVGAVPHGAGIVTVDFCFPEYKRSREDMGHVSSMQITGAILEGGYCAIENALESNLLPKEADADWFYSTLGDWLALRINILFRRALKAGEIGTLKFTVIDIGTQRLRRRRLSATIEFEGFCSGETTWVIDPPEGLRL